MSYQLLPTLIFAVAIFAAILMVLRRLPAARDSQEATTIEEEKPHEKLSQKGLPATAASKIKYHSVFMAKKVWRFILEAKEMAPSGASVLKIRKLFAAKIRPAHLNLSEETSREELTGKTESHYLEAIKKEPKEYAHYDGLGKIYLQKENYSDAKDVYAYLTSHASGTADYWARLGFAAFKLKDYKHAAMAYKKSLSLDSSQPNRYYNLAQSYKALNEVGEALAALNQALSMDPQNFKFLELKMRLEKQQAETPA